MRNKVTGVLRFLGVFTICVGIIIGAWLANDTQLLSFGGAFLIACVINSFLLFGLAEVMNVVFKIYENMGGSTLKKLEISGSLESVQANSKTKRIGISDRKTIEMFYVDSHSKTAIEVVGTPFEDFFLVRNSDGGIDIVELGGFKPQILSAESIINHPQLKDWYESL
ncbi:hypothetical protein [Bacillus sp. SM2101]|uniref:hypothetical protein n=1 Tax=Bacillus sp. SM2101 TaxID=2805366 RepID=UPI001BDF51DE|nr:hypothetical protein [Bacillus sp. SM2101]